MQPEGIATTIEAGNSSGPVSDVIIHHLRMVGATVESEGADIWGLDGEVNAVSRIIIDVVPWVGTHYPTPEEVGLLEEIAAGI